MTQSRNARGISRGEFLKLAGAAGVAGSSLSILSACSVSTSPQEGGGGGDGGFNLYNWSDYVAESTIPGFEERAGVQVTQDFFASNEELLAKLQGGGTGYDVIVPSDYMVEIMIKSDILQELDRSKLPNFENLGANFRDLPYDPGNRYSIPYQWGTTGIVYNTKEVEEFDGWDILWDERYGGQIAMLDDVRETMGAVLMWLGYSINSTDQQQLDEAKQVLIDQKPLARGYFASTEVRPLVENGDALIGHVYSGDGILAQINNPDVRYVIPQPAATRWTDNMAIPRSAPNPDLAHEFINYILGAQVGADLTNYVYYGTPNEAALPMVDEELTEIETYNPPQEVFDRLQIIEDVGETTREYERIFTEIKSA